MAEAKVLRVGDRAHVECIGRRRIEGIDVCLTPSTDPAGEKNYARVDVVELGEHGPPFVVGLEGGAWAYGGQVSADNIEREEGEHD